MKIVLDTNVLISAVLGGRSQRVLDLWYARRFDLIVTTAILSEYLTVLQRPNFKLPRDVTDSIGLYLYRRATIVTPTERITNVASDPNDNMFLEAAIAGSADYVVSGDHHLLDLRQFREVPIVTVRTFLHLFHGEN